MYYNRLRQIMAKIKLQEKREEMKILNDLRLKLEKPLWALDPELAFIDTILNENPGLYEIVVADIGHVNKSSHVGRQDSPTVEQVVRAALYKEIKKLDYRELEYAQEDSRICGAFIKLEERSPFSFEMFQKYISKIRAESLRALMVEINRIMMREEGIEDGRRLRTDSTAVETDIHYPTNNSLIWDCIKTSHRLLKKLEETGKIKKVRNYRKQGKKNEFKINNTKKKEKRAEIFEKQLKLFRTSINQVKRVVGEIMVGADLGVLSIMAELKGLLVKMEKVYDISYRHELLGESVANSEKIFSIYEEHTDILVKGSREVAFGHKVNLTTGRSNLILDCEIVDGNPRDTTLYEGVLERVSSDYGIRPRDMVTDGGYASLGNQEKAKEYGIRNIVFNKIVGSLKNVVTSVQMETRLKKWRSGMEAVISNLKRGFHLFRCEWKGRDHFDAKVLWSVIAYNIRVMTAFMLGKLMPQPQ
jgi:transposase, IS5 family